MPPSTRLKRACGARPSPQHLGGGSGHTRIFKVILSYIRYRVVRPAWASWDPPSKEEKKILWEKAVEIGTPTLRQAVSQPRLTLKWRQS